VVPKPEAEGERQRYFEEVSVGLELPPVVKGPLTTTHLVCWAAANGNYARIHWDLPFAQLRQGLANVVVNGSLKNQYLGQLLLGFAGEEGWFKRFYVEHRGMDYPGDVLTAFGVVTGKREAPADPSSGGGRQEGFGYVDCRMGLRNSRGEQTASGWATVILPKRGQSLPLVWEAED
jgi:acyl dehydratase